MEERIRLRYSGLVTFIDKIFGMFTGLAFTILVIRTLSRDDFGTWRWIGITLNYATIPVGIINFWVWRFVTRDHTNARTALIFNSVLSLPIAFIYLMLSPILAGPIQGTSFPFLLAVALVPLNYLTLTLWNIGGGTKPQTPAYCEMTYETIKVLSAFILVFTLGFALIGAILSFELASFAQLIVFIILLRKYLHGTFKKDVAKQWVSYSWLSAYISQSGTLAALDAIVVIILVGAQFTVVMAYYGVACTIGLMVSLAGAFSYSLTPRLIKGGKASDVETVLKLIMLFGIPMLVGMLIMARPIVYLYSPGYVIVVPLAMVAAVSTFIDLFSGLADTVLMGTVDVDRGKPNFKELARSRLFLSPSISVIMGALYLVILYLVLSYSISSSPISPEEVGLLWAISFLSVKIPFTVFRFWLSKRVLKFRIPYKNIARYCGATIIMAIALILLLPLITYVPSIYQFFLYPLALISIGALIYLAVIFLSDKEFRQLVKTLLRL